MFKTYFGGDFPFDPLELIVFAMIGYVSMQILELYHRHFILAVLFPVLLEPYMSGCIENTSFGCEETKD